jgi:hypothetical protein
MSKQGAFAYRNYCAALQRGLLVVDIEHDEQSYIVRSDLEDYLQILEPMENGDQVAEEIRRQVQTYDPHREYLVLYLSYSAIFSMVRLLGE